MEKLSEARRVLAVFTNPKKAMEDIGNYPTVVVPVVSMIVFPILSVILGLSYYRELYTNLMATQMQTMGVGMDVNALVQVQLYSAMFMAPVMALFGWLAFSILLFLLGHLFRGDGEMGVKKAFSIAGYAYLVTIPFSLLSIILLSINPAYAFTLSLYDIVNRVAPTTNIYVTSLLTMLSIAKLWETALVVIGVKLSKEISTAKAIAIVAILFVLQYAVTIASSVGLTSLLGLAA